MCNSIVFLLSILAVVLGILILFGTLYCSQRDDMVGKFCPLVRTDDSINASINNFFFQDVYQRTPLKFYLTHSLLTDQNGNTIIGKYETRLFSAKERVKEICDQMKGTNMPATNVEVFIKDADFIYSKKHQGAIITVTIEKRNLLRKFNDEKREEIDSWKNKA